MNSNTGKKKVKVCSVADCETKMLAKGLCNKHYKKVWVKGNTKLCGVKDCSNKHYARNYCSKHYRIHAREQRCKVDNCGDYVDTKGYCIKHYRRHFKHGDTTTVKSKKVVGVCGVEGCENEITSLGCCTKHYQRFMKNGDTSTVPFTRIMEHDGKCSIDGCSSEFFAKNLCRTHYNRKRKKEYLQTERGKEASRNNCQKRRALKRKSPFNDFSVGQWRKCLKHFESGCAYCGKKEKVLDQEHVIPISRGGSNTKTNVIPSCGSCNSSKGKKTIFEWYPTSPNYSSERKEKILKYLGYKVNENKIQMQLF